MLTCHDIARYFLALVEEETGDCISNLKLQKLVYYAQGFHLALYNKPLFPETIEAWTHGPVVPKLYTQYKDYGSGPIPPPTDLDLSLYSNEVKDLLDEITVMYGQYSAWKLRNLTHEEPPWRLAQKRPGGVVSHHDMQEYFKTQIQV